MSLYIKGKKIEKLSVQFTLQKITKQYKIIRVEVSEDDWKLNENGSTTMNGKRLAEKALELGQHEINNDGWKEESTEVILNPLQRPEINPGDKIIKLN